MQTWGYGDVAPGSPGGMNFANTPLGRMIGPQKYFLNSFTTKVGLRMVGGSLEMFGKMMVRSSLDDMNDFDMRKLHFHHGTSVATIAFARAISDASNPLPPPAVSRSVSMSQTPMTNQPSLGRQARSADSLAKTPIYIYI